MRRACMSKIVKLSAEMCTNKLNVRRLTVELNNNTKFVV